MRDKTIIAIETLAKSDPDTTPEKLDLIHETCVMPENTELLTRVLRAARGHAGPAAARPRLVRAYQARRILGGKSCPVSSYTLRQLVKTGKLHTFGPLRWKLYSLSELENLI